MTPSAERPNNLPLLARRSTLAGLVGLAGLPALAVGPNAAAQAAALRATPRQSLGPFYPRDAAERPRETDADLLVVDGSRVLTEGVPLYLTGRALDRNGRPVAGALVEIWQCDARAVYHHPAGGAVAQRDPNFQGYGRAQTDADGRFHFRTIRPVAYPGRTPHIHARVEARGQSTIATQLYLPDEPGNARDFLFRQLSSEERAQLLLPLRATDSSHPLARTTALSAAVDLVFA